MPIPATNNAVLTNSASNDSFIVLDKMRKGIHTNINNVDNAPVCPALSSLVLTKIYPGNVNKTNIATFSSIINNEFITFYNKLNADRDRPLLLGLLSFNPTQKSFDIRHFTVFVKRLLTQTAMLAAEQSILNIRFGIERQHRFIKKHVLFVTANHVVVV